MASKAQQYVDSVLNQKKSYEEICSTPPSFKCQQGYVAGMVVNNGGKASLTLASSCNISAEQAREFAKWIKDQFGN